MITTAAMACQRKPIWSSNFNFGCEQLIVAVQSEGPVAVAFFIFEIAGSGALNLVFVQGFTADARIDDDLAWRVMVDSFVLYLKLSSYCSLTEIPPSVLH